MSKSIGKSLERFRVMAKLTISDVSKKTGYAESVIKKAEQGDFWVGILPKLAEVYNVREGDILQNAYSVPFN